MTLSPRRQSCATCALARKTQRAPTIVSPVALAVPGFIVTPSRIKQSSPIVRRTGSPRYFRSCGSWPIAANGKTRVRAPMVVKPAMLTCEISSTPSPSAAPDPTWQNGPIRTPAPRRAPGSTSALGWTKLSTSPTFICRPASPRDALRRRARHPPWLRRGTTTCCDVWRSLSCDSAPGRRGRRVCGTSPCRWS